MPALPPLCRRGVSLLLFPDRIRALSNSTAFLLSRGERCRATYEDLLKVPDILIAEILDG